MRTNTWMLVVAAIALTGSMVIAKSFLPIPGAAEAQPPVKHIAANALPPLLTVPSRNAAQPAPLFVDVTATDSTQMSREQTPSSDPEGQEWTVLVVKGDQLEYVTYPSQHVKNQSP